MKLISTTTLATVLCLCANFASANDGENYPAIGDSVLDEVGAWAMGENKLIELRQNKARVGDLCDKMNEVVIPALDEMGIGHDLKAGVSSKFFGGPYCRISTSFPMADWINLEADEINSSTPEKVADFIQRTLHLGEAEKLAQYPNPALQLKY